MSIDLIQTYLTFTIENGYALYTYCGLHDTKIMWYEDTYYRKNDYEDLFSHPDRRQILSTIEYLVEQTKILDTNKHLVYT